MENERTKAEIEHDRYMDEIDRGLMSRPSPEPKPLERKYTARDFVKALVTLPVGLAGIAIYGALGTLVFIGIPMLIGNAFGFFFPLGIALCVAVYFAYLVIEEKWR